MDAVPYQQAFHRVRAAYLDAPHAQWTPEQIHRLSSIDLQVCQQVFDDLARARFLYRTDSGGYARTVFDRSARPERQPSVPSRVGPTYPPPSDSRVD